MGKKRTPASDESRQHRETEPAENPVKIPNRSVEEALPDLMRVELDDNNRKHGT